jgi:hypothetical protein
MAVRSGGLAAVLDEITPALGPLGPLLSLPGPAEELLPALAPAIHRLLSWLGSDQRQERARADCRRLATSCYDWTQIVDRLEDLYQAAAMAPSTPVSRPC